MQKINTIKCEQTKKYNDIINKSQEKIIIDCTPSQVRVLVQTSIWHTSEQPQTLAPSHNDAATLAPSHNVISVSKKH